MKCIAWLRQKLKIFARPSDIEHDDAETDNILRDFDAAKEHARVAAQTAVATNARLAGIVKSTRRKFADFEELAHRHIGGGNRD